MEAENIRQTIEKALKINLDPTIYGTIAEIGAGQEVARNFFIAGASAGTIAKTMSAYDMQVSDAIYGEEFDGRYVSYSRLQKMVNREYNLVVERLQRTRPDGTRFFAFADTVAARGYRTKKDCHGWMGLKFQLSPKGAPNTILLHVRMKDNSNPDQQAALGILGVNLIYAAYYFPDQPETFINILAEEPGPERIEIDMIEFDGPDFANVDNRLMALHLVKAGIAPAIFFTPEGKTVQPADLFYKKDIMLLRGTFRPFTNVHKDLVACGRDIMSKEEQSREKNTIFITEISMANLMNKGNLDKKDFLGRVDILCRLGFHVQISNYVMYYRLKEYLDQFTTGKISFVLGVRKLQEIFSEKYYTQLKGGILEALGKLFSRGTKLYIYPRLIEQDRIISLDLMEVDDEVNHLFKHFLFNGKLIGLPGFTRSILKEKMKRLADEIVKGDGDWINKVPPEVYEEIQSKCLFGYPGK